MKSYFEVLLGMIVYDKQLGLARLEEVQQQDFTWARALPLISAESVPTSKQVNKSGWLNLIKRLRKAAGSLCSVIG